MLKLLWFSVLKQRIHLTWLSGRFLSFFLCQSVTQFTTWAFYSADLHGASHLVASFSLLSLGKDGCFFLAVMMRVSGSFFVECRKLFGSSVQTNASLVCVL